MIAIDETFRQPMAQALGWALLQFLWQGALIGVLTAALLALLRRSAADVRYVVSTVALALMLTMPVVTAIQTFGALGRGRDPGPKEAFGPARPSVRRRHRPPLAGLGRLHPVICRAGSSDPAASGRPLRGPRSASREPPGRSIDNGCRCS